MRWLVGARGTAARARWAIVTTVGCREQADFVSRYGEEANPHGADVEHAVDALASGGIAVYPTETLYGLGADAFQPAALARMAALKRRLPNQPTSVLVAEIAMLDEIVERITPAASALIARFWPGPLTLVLPARSSLLPLLTGGGDGIGVRLSSHPVAAMLTRRLGRPITAPSANPAGLPAPKRIEEARRYFGERVDAYVDAGELPGEPASTLIDVRGEPRMLRQGAVTTEEVWAVLREANVW
jgi:L-threonylcarbamoyladenylate synthase